MKNIHIIPTDKPSRLWKTWELKLGLHPTITDSLLDKQHIYITSDEEIKEGDWVITPTNDIIQWAKVFQPIGKKIILTTDQSLDGVQAIDDEFLEWYVNNPSCEEVDVVKGFDDGTSYGYNFLDYKIIIPKEEPKQETIEDAAEDFANSKKWMDGGASEWVQHIFKEGAKWQQERMYSEEEVKQMFNRYNEFIAHHDPKEWQLWIDKQFKKK